MRYSIERHIGGYCLVSENGTSIATGAPHMKGTLYFDRRAKAEKFRDLLDVDTMLEKTEWTPKHHALYETIPAIVRDIAGDLFEIKWYSHADDTEMMWEVEHNLLGAHKLAEFKEAYYSLTDDQKNLIYYAYEA